MNKLSWKKFIFISVFFIAFFIISSIYFPDYNNPFYPNKLRNGSQYMAEKWPTPEPNDPNFLRDYEFYMGSKWFFDDDY